MNNKTILTLLLILTFLAIGFAIGFLTNAHLVRKRLQPLREIRTEQGYLDLMQQIMQLSPQQQASTDSILIQHFRQSQQKQKWHRQTMKSQFDSTLLQLKPYINPEQLEKLEKQKQKVRRFLQGNVSDKPKLLQPN